MPAFRKQANCLLSVRLKSSSIAVEARGNRTDAASVKTTADKKFGARGFLFIGGNEDTGRYLPMLLNGPMESTSRETATGVSRFEERNEVTTVQQF
ncbi:hypothetical protein C6495_15015 [Candidatus Poribacteria bacterium]|nr:MAG: hypothetical protein C6495_15015 [Candidatus Poribacteria bacterium]